MGQRTLIYERKVFSKHAFLTLAPSTGTWGVKVLAIIVPCRLLVYNPGEAWLSQGPRMSVQERSKHYAAHIKSVVSR